ncbi:hypothetical protein DFAR_630032 [Desulfarculales bacterium]
MSQLLHHVPRTAFAAFIKEYGT